MLRLTGVLLMTVVISLVPGPPTVSAEGNPPLRWELKRSLDKDAPFEVRGDADEAVVEIHSGIGALALTPQEGKSFPERLVIRLHLKGLESLRLRSGKTELQLSLASTAPHEQRVSLKDPAGDERPLRPGHPLFAELAVLAGGQPLSPERKARLVPLQEGEWIELRVPPALLREAMLLEIDWIDFYR